MPILRQISLSAIFVLILLGCGKSKQLTPLLPDAPDGWSTEGVSVNDVSGVGHSSSRSYVPTGSTASLGVQKVTVQILLGEKGADQAKLQQMSLERAGEFKEQKEVGGFLAYESLPLPSNDTHDLDIVPKLGTYVQIVAYKGGAGWDNADNRRAVVSAFAAKIDLKKIAAVVATLYAQ